MVDALGSLNGDTVTVESLEVFVQHLVALLVDRSTEDVPQLEHGLRNNLNGVFTAVATNYQGSVMVKDFLLEGGQDVLNDIPIVVGVHHAGAGGIREKFGQQTLDEHTLTVRVNVLVLILAVGVLVNVNGRVGTHNEMFRADCTVANLVNLTVAVVDFLNEWDSGYGGGIHE